jgi:hypothetical protein
VGSERQRFQRRSEARPTMVVEAADDGSMTVDRDIEIESLD